jgi:hypothetical protein
MYMQLQWLHIGGAAAPFVARAGWNASFLAQPADPCLA